MSRKMSRPLERQLKILELVNKHIKKKPEEETFYIRFEDFSAQDPLFEDHDSVEEAFESITNDKKNKGFVSINLQFTDTGPMATASGRDFGLTTGYYNIKIRVTDPEDFQEYFLQKKKSLRSGVQEGEINNMLLIEQEDTNKLKVVINEDFDSEIEITLGKLWKTLVAIVNEERVPATGNKDVRTYFNSSPLCPLYSNTGFETKKIIEAKGGYLKKCIPINIRKRRGRKKEGLNMT